LAVESGSTSGDDRPRLIGSTKPIVRAPSSAWSWAA
jgi:hypothetical protein